MDTCTSLTPTTSDKRTTAESKGNVNMVCGEDSHPKSCDSHISRRGKGLQGILKNKSTNSEYDLSRSSGDKSVSFNPVCCIAYFERNGRMLKFDPETYWNWAIASERCYNFTVYQLAIRCAEIYGLDLQQVQRLLSCYRQFIEAKVAVQDFHDNLICPARSVRHVWQLHLGDRSLQYEQFCVLYCGRIIRFNANNYGKDFDIVTEKKIKYTEDILLKLFGDSVDEQIWKFPCTDKLKRSGDNDKKDNESFRRAGMPCNTVQPNDGRDKENATPGNYEDCVIFKETA